MNSVRQKLRVLPVIILVLLTACATVPEDQLLATQADLTVTGQMDDMMEFYESLRKQPPAELTRIYDRVKRNFVQNKSDSNRTRLVLLLILPHTTFRDITSATYLLNEWPRDSKPATNLQSFRNLLAGLLAEQQRLTHSVEELSQKFKDEQKRVETLQNQIDAIKSMEKNLILREL